MLIPQYPPEDPLLLASMTMTTFTTTTTSTTITMTESETIKRRVGNGNSICGFPNLKSSSLSLSLLEAWFSQIQTHLAVLLFVWSQFPNAVIRRVQYPIYFVFCGVTPAASNVVLMDTPLNPKLNAPQDCVPKQETCAQLGPEYNT